MRDAAEAGSRGVDCEPKDRAIGIFDSGIGGLTVSREIMNILPSEHVVYLGDTARVPYGTKSRRTVRKYVESTTGFLLSKNVKTLVVACNTASAYAVETLRENLDIPVVGVVEPGAKKAAGATVNGKIGIIGTQATVRSGAYEKKLRELGPAGLEIRSKPCPLFVPLAEEGWENDETALLVAEKYLAELRESAVDVLILGCTHYPLLKNTIAGVMGNGVALVDSAEETARETRRVLAERELLRDGGAERKTSFYLTDDSDAFTSVASRFLGRPVEKTEVVDIV